MDLSSTAVVPMSGGGGGAGELCLTNGQLCSADTVKFEEKRMTSASKTKVITDGFSSEQVRFYLFFCQFAYVLIFIFVVDRQPQIPLK